MNGVFSWIQKMHILVGQALEDIVLRGTDIYAFGPMENRDRAQVRAIADAFFCSWAVCSLV